MFNPGLCSTLLDHVRSLGHDVTRFCFRDYRTGRLMVFLEAIAAADGRTFIVRAPVDEEYEAIIELCQMAGIDWMDG